MASATFYVSLVVLLFIIIIIIIQIIVSVILFENSNDKNECPECPTQNCNITGTPYFDSEFPYFFDDTNCVSFSTSSPVTFSYVNLSDSFIRIIPQNLSTDNSCSNLTDDMGNYFNKWQIIPFTGTIYFSNRIFITNGHFLSLFVNQKIKFYSSFSNVAISVSFNGELVDSSFIVPNVSFLEIGITGVESEGSLLININT